MKKNLIFVFCVLFLFPHLGNATGINIRDPDSPLSRFIIKKEKAAIEKKLWEDGQGAWEYMVEGSIPLIYMLGGRALPEFVQLKLSIRNLKTGQTAPFPKGTLFWFEMRQSIDNGETYEKIPNSNWIMGNARVLLEETPTVSFKGQEIISKIAKIVDEKYEYCLYIWID